MRLKVWGFLRLFCYQERFILVALLFAVLFFVLFPRIDIVVSALLFTDKFYLNDNAFLDFLFYNTQKISIFIASIVFFVAIIAFFMKNKKIIKGCLFLFGSGMLGPLIIVNLVLKNFIGRPRPRQIVEFGGDYPFVKIFDFTASYCDSNCSFVCGHCSAGFFMLAFAYLFGGKTKWFILTLGFIWGVLVSFARIAQGGHFLSDAIFAFLFTLLSIKFVYHAIYEPRTTNAL